MKLYSVEAKVNHDSGSIKFHSSVLSSDNENVWEKAVKLICEAENCPRRAISAMKVGKGVDV